MAIVDGSIVWWHWVVVGAVLLIAEMSTGTFLLLGIGLAAVIVGGMDYLLHTTFVTELLTWTALSVVVLAVWIRWFREPTISTTGQSDHGLDVLGTVLEPIAPHRRGKVIFDAPVLGNTTWHATASEPIPEGARVRIVEVKGQLIEVTPLQRA